MEEVECNEMEESQEIDKIKWKELIEGLKRTENRKATGKNGLNGELFKYSYRTYNACFWHF